jgi:hypothetical protein
MRAGIAIWFASPVARTGRLVLLNRRRLTLAGTLQPCSGSRISAASTWAIPKEGSDGPAAEPDHPRRTRRLTAQAFYEALGWHLDGGVDDETNYVAFFQAGGLILAL